MSKLETIKATLEETIYSELDRGIENVDCDEMSQAIDMLKDISETMYYCSIVKGMKEDNSKVYLTPESYNEMTIRNTDDEVSEIKMSRKYRKLIDGINEGMSHQERMNMVDDFVRAMADDVVELASRLNVDEKQIIKSRVQMMLQQL